MERSTYFLIGRTNPYQAQAGRNASFFKRRTLAASNEWWYVTRQEAAALIMEWASDDAGEWPDEQTGVLLAGCSDQVDPGDLRYHHDGYSWAMTPLEELDEEEATAVLRDCWLNDENREAIYQLHEDLRPEPEPEEEDEA